MFVRGKTFQPSLTFANDAKCDTWKGCFLANTYLTMVNSSFNIWPSIIFVSVAIAWLGRMLKSPSSWLGQQRFGILTVPMILKRQVGYSTLLPFRSGKTPVLLTGPT